MNECKFLYKKKSNFDTVESIRWSTSVNSIYNDELKLFSPTNPTPLVLDTVDDTTVPAGFVVLVVDDCTASNLDAGLTARIGFLSATNCACVFSKFWAFICANCVSEITKPVPSGLITAPPLLFIIDSNSGPRKAPFKTACKGKN